MPHVIIEFAQELANEGQQAVLADAVHAAVTATGLFEPNNVKTRLVPLTVYRLGDQTRPFIHVQCRIHVGRDEQQKRALSAAVLAAVRGQGLSAQVITVELVEMDRASYAKHDAG